MRTRAKHGPEFRIQQRLIEYLETRGWLVERVIGNAYQHGLPDLYAFHPKWGQRWIELKNPARYSFTKAQKAKFPRWEKFGLGIWILTGADQENYDRLFAPPNLRTYWRGAWNRPDVDRLLGEIR